MNFNTFRRQASGVVARTHGDSCGAGGAVSGSQQCLQRVNGGVPFAGQGSHRRFVLFRLLQTEKRHDGTDGGAAFAHFCAGGQ